MLRYAGSATVAFRIDRALPGAESIPQRWYDAVAALAKTADA